MAESSIRRIALWSAAGGTGKTTITINLAAALAERGKRILVVDLDPHACLLRALGQRPGVALHSVLEEPERLAQSIRPSEFAGLHLLTASPDLDTNERPLRSGGEWRLRTALDSLGNERWDFLLLDCGPGANQIAVAALGAAEEVISPIEPSPISVGTLAIACDLADAVRRDLNPDLSPLRILLSRVSDAPTTSKTIDALRERFDNDVLTAEIPNSSAVLEASANLEPVLTLLEDDPASDAFRNLAGELLGTP